MIKLRSPFLVWILICVFLSSCASTGPKISKEERKRMEEEFNSKFLGVSERPLDKVYRVGYKLLTTKVPFHGGEEPKYGFVGVGVDELKDYARKLYEIDESVRGVLVRGLYPGSKAEGLDVRPGDVVERLDGKKIKSLGTYFKVIRSTGKPVLKAEIRRKGELLEREFPVERIYYNAQFFLVPTPDVDAGSLYSKIMVGIGAIRYCKNDDELAVVMGHELAHTTLKHFLKKTGIKIASGIAFGVLASTLNYFTFSVLGSLLVQPAYQATDAAVTRRYEREADYFGMKHAFHAGYNVEHGAKIFDRLATDEPGYNVITYTFSTHPKWPERYLRLEKIVEELERLYPEEASKMIEIPDWEVTVPVERGETIAQALDRLAQMERPTVSAAAA